VAALAKTKNSRGPLRLLLEIGEDVRNSWIAAGIVYEQHFHRAGKSEQGKDQRAKA
jgi:hypothetical protein